MLADTVPNIYYSLGINKVADTPRKHLEIGGEFLGIFWDSLRDYGYS